MIRVWRAVTAAEAQPYHEVLFGGLRADAPVTAGEVAAQTANRRRPGLLPLATLDDPGQAFYTSFHAVQVYDLWAPMPDEGEDAPEDVPPEQELARRQHHLAQKAAVLPTNELLWSDDEEEACILAGTVSFPPPVYIQDVPADAPDAAFAALPNGYFSDDLDPFACLAVIRALDATGLTLFGVGASYLGFRAEAGADEAAAGRIAASLYEGEPVDAEGQAVRAARSGTLLLRFTR